MKYTRNQWPGKYLTVQLNSWQVKRKELKTKVCNVNFLLQNATKYMEIVSCANTFLLDSQKLLFWLMFQEHCWGSFTKITQHNVEGKRWTKNKILFLDHYNKLNTRQFRYENSFKHILRPRMPLHCVCILTRYCNKS